jgi:outer membrane protein TolC
MQFFRDVWDKRHDTKAAEASLFVKEMAVIEEKRKRIPSLNAAFGLGSLSLSSTFSQAPVVIQLGASMPLLDFGDIKRGIGKATIERDLARRNIDLLLMKIQRGVLDSSAALSEAIAARKAIEGQRELISAQSEASQKLVAAGLVDPVDLLNFKVRASELDIELAQARISVSKAAAEYALASGRSLAGPPPVPSQEKAK